VNCLKQLHKFSQCWIKQSRCLVTLVDLKTLWPGYTPVVVGLRGNKKLSKILNSPGDFDDKMVIVDASAHDGPEGQCIANASRPCTYNTFLHDASVKSLDELLDRKARQEFSAPILFRR
jgi:hypothetical protein